MIKERRKHPRLRIPLEAEYLVAGQEEWRQGTIWTLGAGGAALLCEEELDLGTLLEGLHFVVEAEGDLPETRIEVAAEVVNIDRQANFGRHSNFMLGLQFSSVGEREFELLRQFVFRRLTANGGARHDAGESADSGERPPIEIRFKLFDEFVEEVSENLSPTGMFIRAHRPLPPGSQFVFQFQLGDDFSLFQGTAEVVWTRRRGEGPDRPPGMGVRFVSLDLTSQKMVRRLVGQQGAAAAEEAGQAADDPAPPPQVVAQLAEESGEPFPIAQTLAAAAPPAEPEAAASAAADGERLAELRRGLARLESELDEALAARDAAHERRDEAEAKSSEAQARLVELGEEAEILRQENETLRSSCGEAEEGRARAEAEAGDLARELDAVAGAAAPPEELAELRQEHEDQRREWTTLEAELRDELARRTAGEAELRDRVEQGGETEAELRRGLERAAEMEAGLRQRLERAEAESEAAERQAERAEAAEEAAEEVRHELAEGRREWDATEAELRAQLKQKTIEEAEARDRLEEAVGAEAELRQRLSELRGSRDEMEQRLAQGAEVEDALREQAQELRAERDELRARLARAARALDGMRAAAGELDSRFNGDLDSARALEADLSARLAEVAAVGAGLDRKVAGLAEVRAGLADRLARIGEAWSSLGDGLRQDEDLDLDLDPIASSPAVEGAAPPGEAAEETVDPVPPPPPDEEPLDARRAPGPPAEEAAEVEATEAVPAEEATQVAAAETEPAEETGAAEEAAPPLPAATEPPAEEAPDTAEIAAPPPPETPPAGASRLLGAARRVAARLGLASASRQEAVEPPAEDDRLMAVEPQEADEPEPASSAEPDDEAIEETVRAWAAAWSERRVEDYLAFYSKRFEPARPEEEADGAAEAPHAWLPPLAGMELTLGPISRTELEPGRFAVRFEQSVETDSYTRRTGRTLEMVREADAWKIAAESFQELPN